MGFDIFNHPEGYSGTGLGHSHTFTSVLKPGQKGVYTLHFDLGAAEENQEVKLLPPPEEMQQLEREALNANLIVTLGDEEVARFDLKPNTVEEKASL
ncbi:hypothetical protein [Desulfoscipio geothermicus]|uniref:hypothetical protein n=1 Tax=Desulfoscipio geothermicus TaxID=39060 RepID=UPI001041FC9B|nr:hypothetical protein [Desulfoscipio geothermicus]